MDAAATSIDISLVKNEISLPGKLFLKKKESWLTGLLRKLVCEHQGFIIEHIYWAAEIHKELRLAIESENKEKIKRKLEQLDNDLPAIFQNSWRISVDLMKNYFAITHKSEILPRMCIKATITRNKEQYIVDVFREDGGFSDLTYKVSENTGFKTVHDDGQYYKCNNIPVAVKEGRYINPRLNLGLAKRYKFGTKLKIRNILFKKRYDESWAECWLDYKKEKENWTSCYKSTIIIPMTLINNHQSSRFIQNTMVGVSKDARSIYGFLCFDHVETDYFNDNDINVGYILADLLSFYMINNLNFTEYSSTYTRAKEIIRNESF